MFIPWLAATGFSSPFLHSSLYELFLYMNYYFSLKNIFSLSIEYPLKTLSPALFGVGQMTF